MKNELMLGKSAEEITGDEAREIIEKLQEIGDKIGYSPSEKQSALRF